MGKKIASLYAEISGDTTKLNTALKDTKTELGGVKTAANEMANEAGTKITSLIAPAALASAAIMGIKDALDTTVRYAENIGELSQLTGMSPEEASHLVAAAKDIGVSYQDLSSAMETAIKKGFDPSASGLEDIRVKYNSLKDPIEKSKLLFDTFGTAGTEMAGVLELPRDRLQEIADNADKVGLTMTGANLQAVDDYTKSMSRLDSSVMGLKIRLGNELIPKFVWFLDHGAEVEGAIDKQTNKWLLLFPVLYGLRTTLEWIINAYNSVTVQSSTPSYQASMQSANANVGGFAYTPYASGADFTVPPGFSGDGMGMRVSSGEKVKVTQAGVGDTTDKLMRNLPEMIRVAVRDGMLQAVA